MDAGCQRATNKSATNKSAALMGSHLLPSRESSENMSYGNSDLEPLLSHTVQTGQNRNRDVGLAERLDDARNVCALLSIV
jgi:hypothetical protein